MQDILLNDTGDVKIENGDFAVGISDFQHQEHLLVFQKGALKENLTVGVGIENFLRESDIDGLEYEVNVQFTRDGMVVKSVSFDEQTGNLQYDANYTA